ncbi:MAG TPA: HlyD family type I secretion periplasmic adaptor subunit [Syntrophorhabdaceae bacterium]|nr:HlyD family type I secretion periplasmic adaptor subunit [Syntrophorhabdaceae bacterium]HQM82715.1 HlyD family type I secretion periplasmic adaptor subunit [Syntrophorhabdaceae bacterium]
MFRKIIDTIVRWPQWVFRKDDAYEFKPTMAEIEERPANPLGRIVFWIIVATMVFFATWMCIGKIDVVVSARGMVIPEGDVKILQPLDTGVVSAILCREGDFVKKDQVLMEVDPSITAPELDSKKKSLQYLELEKMRLNAAIGKGGFSPDKKTHDAESIRTQQELYRSSVEGLREQLDAKRAELHKTEEEIKSAAGDRVYNTSLLEIAKDREKRLREVADIISKSEYEKAVNDVLTYGNNIEQLTHKLEELAQQKSRILHEIAYITESFRTTTLKEYSDKHKAATEINAEIDKTNFRNEKQKILSPVDGYVSNLYFHTIGGVVTPAQKLMTVVPFDTPLVVRATVLNKDIGFVKDGMPVSIKIDAFDFQKYGIVNGTMRSISKHSTDDEKLGPVYEVFITPLETTLFVEGKRVPITSGMSLTAEIKVGKRRIIEFFIYPLIKYLDEGIKVR